MIQHTELIARLRGLTGTLKSGAWSTIAEAADALQAMEPSELDKTADNNKVICPNCCHQFTAIPVNVQTRLQALERVTWQPIETAPKDGTQVMLTNGISVAHGNWLHAEPFIREIRDLEGRYIDQDESDGYDGWIDFIGGMMPEPTLWMPLPTPPESKG